MREARTTSSTFLPAPSPTRALRIPPYNVQIRSIVGRGVTKHREFAMASGEMSRDAFVAFLRQTLSVAAQVSVDGAVHFVCMDWRHVDDLVSAGRAVYGDMLNLVAGTPDGSNHASSQ